MTPIKEAFETLLPEPAYKITSKMGEFICLRAKTYDNKKGDGLYTADQMRQMFEAATERAAKLAAGAATDAAMNYANGHPVDFEMVIGDAIRGDGGAKA